MYVHVRRFLARTSLRNDRFFGFRKFLGASLRVPPYSQFMPCITVCRIPSLSLHSLCSNVFCSFSRALPCILTRPFRFHYACVPVHFSLVAFQCVLSERFHAFTLCPTLFDHSQVVQCISSQFSILPCFPHFLCIVVLARSNELSWTACRLGIHFLVNLLSCNT